MTAITDATAMIEVLIDRTVTGQELINIGSSFVRNDPYHIGGWWDIENPEDPQEEWTYIAREPTNEEIAQHFLDTMLAFGRAVHRDAVEFVERTVLTIDIDRDVTAAGDAAVAEFT